MIFAYVVYIPQRFRIVLHIARPFGDQMQVGGNLLHADRTLLARVVGHGADEGGRRGDWSILCECEYIEFSQLVHPHNSIDVFAK